MREKEEKNNNIRQTKRNETNKKENKKNDNRQFPEFTAEMYRIELNAPGHHLIALAISNE